MGPLVVCCTLWLNLNLNPLYDILKQPIIFLESIFNKNTLPTQTKNSKSYTIALVGDSMTQYLGSGDPLRDSLKKLYPGKEFGILNFGIGSTNILTLPDRLVKESKRGDETLPPILDTKPDIILLESFGNNPLSQFKLEQGLKKQKEILDQIIKIIKEKNPQTVLVFVATIAPSKERYAEGIVVLMPDQRKSWAEERIAYIQNHIDYAKAHKIPLINIYEKSLNDKGEANIDYLNSKDFIHPSDTGIQLIDSQIAEEISKQKIIPN